MSNASSLLKANYCRSIMRTASFATSAEAIRLMEGLKTEVPTQGTTPEVAVAEAAALDCIIALADHLSGRTAVIGGLEWTKAGRAVEQWISAAE
jgi:hypothetical protein